MPLLPQSLTLRDGELALRDWRDADAPALQPVCGECEVCQFTSVPWAYSAAAARAWVHRVQCHRMAGTGVALAITREPDDVALGNVNLVSFSDDGSSAALGYWLVPSARRRGLATRAARLLCCWGFEQLGLARIELAVLPGNLRSQAVAERLGAVCEGLRADSREAGGRRWDMVIYLISARL